MKRLLFFALLSIGLFAGPVMGQQYPHYSNYLFNPYSYNPAAAGNNENIEMNLTYRQQWLGIKDAPVTQSFNYQMPLKDRVSLGVNFYHDQTVLLNTSAMMVAFAYTIPMEKHHFIKLGLSAGLGMNSFDLEEVGNPSDPALLNALDQSTFMTGQFGIWYYNRGLKLGFSLPQLYKHAAIDTAEFQTIEIDRFDNFILSASKQFNVRNTNLIVEPFITYRKNELERSVFEAGSMLSYQEVAWFGASYSNRETLTAYVGLQVLDNIRLHYAYEHTTGGYYAGIGSGSHEISLKISLGKGRANGKKITPTMAMQEKKRQQMKRSKARGVAPKPSAKQPDSENNAATTAVSEQEVTQTTEIAQTDDTEGMEKGYHLVFNAFESESNALQYAQMLQGKRIPVKIHFVPERQLFYVHAYHDASRAVVLEKYKNFKKTFEDIWIHKVN